MRKETGLGMSLGRGIDWVEWSRQGLGRGLNLGEDRVQAGAGALVRAWPESVSEQDQGLSLEQGSEGTGPGPWSGTGLDRA